MSKIAKTAAYAAAAATIYAGGYYNVLGKAWNFAKSQVSKGNEAKDEDTQVDPEVEVAD